MQYRREIDGLRAVSVLSVILFHAGFEPFRGGYTGVDVFFVISGYLITRILLTDLETDRFSLSRFYESRLRRIIPALFFVILSCLPFSYLWMTPSQLKDFALSMVYTVLFASNVLFAREDSYFAAATGIRPLLHSWSLAVEGQYYLLFPVFLAVLWRLGRRPAFWTAVVGAVVSFLWAEWCWRAEPDAGFYLASARAWELLAGSICAFLARDEQQWSSNPLSSLGFALIVIAIVFYDDTRPSPSFYTLLPVGGAALVLLFAAPDTWVARLLSTRGLVGIGLVSYSAYLWHQPVFAFARLRSLTEPGPALMALLAATSLILAWATWSWVEQPLRRRTGSVLSTRRGAFVATGAAGAAFVALGLAGYLDEGFEWRLTDTARQLYATAMPSPLRDRCHFNRGIDLSSFKFCEYFAGDADVAIYGNSHAVELAYALAETRRSRSRSVAHFSISGCTAGFGIELERYCSDFYANRLQYILDHAQLRKVVITFRAEFSGTEGANSIVKLANFLNEHGKHVVLVLQAPMLPHDIHYYLKQAFLTGERDVAARPRSEWLTINRRVYEALGELRPNVAVVDMADYFCDANSCFAVRDGGALYFDDDHMSIFGARRVAADIARLLE